MLSALWIVVSGRVNVGGGEGSVHGRETAGGGGTAGGGIGGGGGGIGLDLDFETRCKGFNVLRTNLPLVFLCHVLK